MRRGTARTTEGEETHLEKAAIDDLRSRLRKFFDRLVEVKTKWDPGNLFRRNKNIAPKMA